MKIGFAVTTLGPHRPLGKLLDSLSGQLRKGDWLIISAVEGRESIEKLVDRLDFGDAQVRVVAGPRGASAGRNYAVDNAPHVADRLLFPNDTSWFPPDFIKSLRSNEWCSTAGALTVVDELGPKFVLPKPGTALTRANVWSVIEPGLVMEHHTFVHLGGFKESIGTGAQSPWQSGEGTELLLRWMSSASTHEFDWIRAPVVYGISDPFGLTDRERRRKLRAYARGYGRLLVTGNFALLPRIRAIAGGLSFGLRKGRPYKWTDGAWVFVGRVEGIIGRTILHQSTILHAVDK